MKAIKVSAHSRPHRGAFFFFLPGGTRYCLSAVPSLVVCWRRLACGGVVSRCSVPPHHSSHLLLCKTQHRSWRAQFRLSSSFLRSVYLTIALILCLVVSSISRTLVIAVPQEVCPNHVENKVHLFIPSHNHEGVKTNSPSICARIRRRT